MAVLKLLGDSSIIYLKPIHIFGRDPAACDSVLEHQSCSRIHLVLRWNYGSWTITDLSRNGSYLNGNRIEHGQGINIKSGDVFFAGYEQRYQWLLEDEAEPKPVLVNCKRKKYLELNNFNCWRDNNKNSCEIFNHDGYWILKKDHQSHILYEGCGVTIGGDNWIFFPNYTVTKTQDTSAEKPGCPELVFDVSRNEEHVALTFNYEQFSIPLGTKAHFYFLLELARHRIQDNTISISEKGWISNDYLIRKLGFDISVLNMQIYRIRNSLRQYSPYWGGNLIERRRGEVRLRECDVVINKA